MRYSSTLIPGTLARRYKRFLADVVLESGEMTTVHVANPGAMTGLDRPFSRVWLSGSDNPLRKLPLTWELVETDLGSGIEFVGVNTQQPNTLVAEALKEGLIPELRHYTSVRQEVKYGAKSRVDFLLEEPIAAALLCRGQERAPHAQAALWPNFPTASPTAAPSTWTSLPPRSAAGARAVMLFLIQIASADRFAVARDIDPAYAAAFDAGARAGVQMLAWRCNVNLDGIEIAAPVPIIDE